MLVSYNIIMIFTFGDKETMRIWEGEQVKGLPREIQDIAGRKLRMINYSITSKMVRNAKYLFA